jgi:hypothetical protein
MQQHTGVPPIIMQQVQPAFMQAITQSQQPWIMSQQPLSPLVQVMIQPSLVISHLHMPIVMLQQQTIIPFIMQQKVHIPPAIMVQRFCIMAQLAGSVQVQVTFMPPVHFSIFMVQRGTMTIFGVMLGMPDIPMPGVLLMPVADIGVIIAVLMVRLQLFGFREFSSWPSSAARLRSVATREMITRREPTAIATEPLYIRNHGPCERGAGGRKISPEMIVHSQKCYPRLWIW